MSRTALLTRRSRAALAVAALVCATAVVSPGAAEATPAHPTDSRLTSAALLQLEDVRAGGLVADSARLGLRGDQYLGDAGRFDEGCLGEKTIRNITSAKAYPAPGTATAYFDGVWESTVDKDVWVNESIAEGRTTRDTNRYVRILFDEIRSVRDCEEDPAQGHYYGRPHKVRVGAATATYFLDYTSDGRADGGGVAVIRDGKRFGFVSLMFGAGDGAKTLRKLSTSAAANLR